MRCLSVKEEISHEFIAKKIDCSAMRSLRLFIMSKLTFITEEGVRVKIVIFLILMLSTFADFND